MATQTITINDANRYDLPVALQDLQTDNILSIRMNADGDLIIQFRDGMELIIDDYDANANLQQAIEVSLSDGSIMSLEAMQAYMDMQGFDVASLSAARLNNIQTAAGPLGATQQDIDEPEQAQEIATLDEVELEAIVETDAANAQNGIASLSDDMLFVADADNAPASLLDGMAITAATNNEDVALAEIEPAAGEDLASIEPAAGDAAGAIAGGGGLGFNSSVDQTSALDIFAVGPVGPTALQFGLPEPQDQPVNPDILNAAVPQSTPQPIAGAASQQVFEDNSIAPTINAQPSVTDGSVQITVSITGIPSNVGVNTASSGGTYNAGTGTWTITLPAGQGITAGPLLTPPANSDVDLSNLTLSVTETELSSGDTITVTNDFSIIVDAVADTPTVAANNTGGQELQSVPLNISTAVTDLDGSESIREIRVSGLPSGATMNNGSLDTTTGEWVLNTGDLAGLEINLPNGSEGTYTLNIVAQSFDNPTDSEITTANNIASANTSVTLTITDGETPIIGVTPIGNVDESSVSQPKTVSGTINVDFGNDTPGSITPNGNVTISGSVAGGSLTSGGVPVTTSVSGGVVTGTAGGVTVFTLEVNPNTGGYNFSLFQPLDHADGTNPDDVISIEFDYVAQDSDGDMATGSVRVDVIDDAPVAVNDVSVVPNTQTTVTGNVITNDDAGFDTNATVTNISFGGTSVAVPATGTTTINGTYGTLTIAADGTFSYTKSTSTDNDDVFTYTLTDADGDSDTATLTLDLQELLDPPVINGGDTTSVDESNVLTTSGNLNITYDAGGPGSVSANATNSNYPSGLSSNGTAIAVTLTTVGGQSIYTGTAGGTTVFTFTLNSDGSYNYEQFEQIDHPDTTSPDDALVLRFGFTATDTEGEEADGAVSVTVRDDGPVAVNDTVSAEQGGNTATGNVLSNDDAGFDNPGVVTQASLGSTTVTVPSSGSVTLNGAYGSLTISADGSYSYTTSSTDGTDNFVYTIRDTDGDTDTATLSATSTDDDQPVITSITGNLHADESSAATRTLTGQVNVDYGNDGTGAFTTENGAFSASMSLTSLGAPVTVSVIGGQYVGTAGGRTIFTLDINSNGSFTFSQLDQIDHPNTSNMDEPVFLSFGVRAQDGDGDRTNGSIVIRLDDDGPVAVNDTATASESGTAVSGNVLSNDDAGFDSPGTVSEVSIGGSSVNVPSSGTITINGAYGTLTIAANGSYTYTPASNGGGVDSFTYTLTDADGDSDYAELRVTVSEDDDQPVITSITGNQHADESSAATRTISGQVNVDYGNDGAGAFTTENGTFSSSTGLTSLGAAVTVTLSGGQYVGTAGGRTIFTMDIQSNGSYTFRLLDSLDHPNTNNPDEPIYLDFGVRAQDGDGDRTDGTVRIRVDDDGPQAVDDSNTVSGDGGSVNGNVLTNDQIGFDDNNSNADVTQVRFGGTIINIPASGFATITGAHGVLQINKFGAYSYTSTDNSGQTDVFEYTIRDADGDTATADLSIDQTPTTVPPVTNVTADINAPDFYEDTSTYQSLDISAGYNGGNGNETMTLRITGIPNDWEIESTDGFTFVNGGWEKTVNSSSYNSNGFRLRPSRDNSDDDGNIRLDVRVNDPDHGTSTATDSDRAIVDAVADNVDINYDTVVSANNHIMWQSVPITSNFPDPRVPAQPYIKKISQIFGIDLRDTDGSESITSIEITFTGSTSPLVTPTPGVYYPPISFSHGTAQSLAVGSEMLNFALNNFSTPANYKIKYTFSLQEFMQAEIQSGFGPIRADIKVFSGETDLTDQELTTSNNTAVQTDSVMMTVGNISLSPLVLDLDGDGVELSNLGETETYFDLNGDGILEGTGWVRPDDGLLAIDNNRDGIINDGTELFGDQGGEFANGFDSLARLDSNQDGQVNDQDAQFADLVVWRDLNADGVSQVDELVTLSDLGISGISLDAVEVWKVDGTNYISHEASFIYEDGREGLIVDAWFKSVGIDKTQGADIYDEYEQAQEDAIAQSAMMADQQSDEELSELIEMLQSYNITAVDFAEGDMIDLSDLVGTQTDLDQAIEAFVISSDTGEGEAITIETAQTYLGNTANMADLAAVDLEQLFTTMQAQNPES